jgi:hypothetical protein
VQWHGYDDIREGIALIVLSQTLGKQVGQHFADSQAAPILEVLDEYVHRVAIGCQGNAGAKVKALVQTGAAELGVAGRG